MDNKNDLPLSPHLQVYKPQLTSVLSIAHRISGFGLSLSLPLFLIWLICILLGPQTYSFLISVCSNNFFKIVFVSISFGLTYHMLNGIRHIMWDFGYGIDIKFSSISAILILIFSFLLTLFVSIKFIF